MTTRRRPHRGDQPAFKFKEEDVNSTPKENQIGIVLSGGGSRSAYQVGALKALEGRLLEPGAAVTSIVGSSIGAVNGLVLGACLRQGVGAAIRELEALWIERNFRNTFTGSPSRAFFKAIGIAARQYLAPGPHGTRDSVFDPSPLMKCVDAVIERHGGLRPKDRHPELKNVAVIATVEGRERKPLLFLSSHQRIPDAQMHGASFEVCYVDRLTAKHGFASAALPSILPPVDFNTEEGRISLVDGGISQNLPVDPAVRLGSDSIIMIDISGRDWWFDRFGEPHDTRPTWEVPAGLDTFCMRPPSTFVSRCIRPLGPLLRDAVSGSRKQFIAAVGPVWPLFSLLKRKLGEEVAYEAMSYVALDRDYVQALIQRGYEETVSRMTAGGAGATERES